MGADGCAFGELFAAPVRNGLTKPTAIRGAGTKMVNMGELFAYDRLNEVPMDRVPLTDAEAKNCLLHPGDLLFARQSLVLEGAGKCSIFVGDAEPVTFESHVTRVRLNPQVADPLFYFYFLQSRPGRSAIRSIVEQGAGASGIRGSDLVRLSVPLPPLSEQKRIAHILGTLDDKIELNRRMCQTLEEMARALFKSWFVDFDPVRAKAEGRQPAGMDAATAALFPDSFQDSELGEIPIGWEVGPLSEFFALGLGGAWGDDGPTTSATVAVQCLRGIDCHDLAEGRTPEVPLRWVSPKQAAARALTEGVILIEGSGSFCGRSVFWRHAYEALFGAPVGYSNFCKRLDPRCTVAQAAICWMQMRQAYREGLLHSFRTGTAFPNFDVHGVLSNLIVVVPPVPLAEAYGEMLALGQRLDLVVQTRALAALRDAMLPELVSGELLVKDGQSSAGRFA